MVTNQSNSFGIANGDTEALLAATGSMASQKAPHRPIREYFPEYVGKSPVVQRLLELVYKAAQTDSSVLIYGESGTGKELIASALHRLSYRSRKRFVPINCSAIPENLLETELFGCEKGAYTGAVNRRQGHFEFAEGGTLFLDEIGEMAPSLQVKLLRVLQERQYSPVGSSHLKTANVRVVAATNVRLEEAVKKTQFRLDLYYRLNVVPITLPPLRERGDDIILLVEHFLQQLNRRYPGHRPCYLDDHALQAMRDYAWPGNIRELQNVVERLVVTSGGGRLSLNALPEEICVPKTSLPNEWVAPRLPHGERDDSRMQAEHEQVQLRGDRQTMPQAFELPDHGVDLTSLIEEIENKYILEALRRTNNNKNRAAKLLGLNRTTLVERIKKRKIAPLNLPSKEL